jgi:hypothetical protein
VAAGMTDPSPAVIVLDVNETLSDMAPMAGRFAEVGLPHADAAIWFAAVLRDGMGLTAAGAPRPFARIAAGSAGTGPSTATTRPSPTCSPASGPWPCTPTCPPAWRPSPRAGAGS